MLGAPLDTMTLLHHAEHVADFPDKRVIRYEVSHPRRWPDGLASVREFDTGNPPDGLPEDYFATIVEQFLATGEGKRDTIGAAPSVLVPADRITAFGVRWLEAWARSA